MTSTGSFQLGECSFARNNSFMAVLPQHAGANHNYVCYASCPRSLFEICSPQPCACQVSDHGCKEA